MIQCTHRAALIQNNVLITPLIKYGITFQAPRVLLDLCREVTLHG
jgi:hypothetical protein